VLVPRVEGSKDLHNVQKLYMSAVHGNFTKKQHSIQVSCTQNKQVICISVSQRNLRQHKA
jgi:hypothetical protein